MEHDGIEYVVAAYGITAATLVVWFAMIIAKLRRYDDAPAAPANTPPAAGNE